MLTRLNREARTVAQLTHQNIVAVHDLVIHPRDSDLIAGTGDSVAISGVCLTVVAVEDGRMRFDVVPETIRRTSFARLAADAAVNVEDAVRAGEPLGGHVVQGHVDGTGEVADKLAIEHPDRIEVVPYGVDPLRFHADPGVRAAWLYYVEGLTQEQIARAMNVSRAKVIRLLAAARESGVVRIRIDGAGSEQIALEHGSRIAGERLPIAPNDGAAETSAALAIA